MRKIDAQALIESYLLEDERDRENQRRILSFLDETENPFDRACEGGHFTASAWLLNRHQSKVLLTHHRKFNQWLQLGGHIEPGDQDLLSAAIREAKEESGLTSIEPLDTAPFDIDIHWISATSKEPAHVHYDVRFLLYSLSEEANIFVSNELNRLKWFGSNEGGEDMDRSVMRLFHKWRQRNG